MKQNKKEVQLNPLFLITEPIKVLKTIRIVSNYQAFVKIRVNNLLFDHQIQERKK